MDYTNAPVAFRILKALRYVRLYGPRRTLVKIKGQYHMKKRPNPLPQMSTGFAANAKIGIIGCGNYAYSNIAYYLHKNHGRVIRAAMDVDINKAASLFEAYHLNYYTDDPSKIIEDPEIKLVFVASNHRSHAEYAIDSINADKHVHIEKPHVVSRDQLNRLMAAMRKRPEICVFLGFNRPRSKLFNALQSTLHDQSGPLMINWFIAGHEIPADHWYFDEKEGGRVLGNLCHWTDLTLHLVSLERSFPCTIVPSTPQNADSDFVVSMMFQDRSCATITFSAKGHTFEGVREVLNLHKGDVLANLTDFQSLGMDVVQRRRRKRSIFRDHGHEANIMNSYACLEDSGSVGEEPYYIEATAMFFLAIKEAIDTGAPVTLTQADFSTG